MKLAIDARWQKSGIGAYFKALLPYFQKHFDCVLINEGKPFSEDLFPKKSLLKTINSCDAYYTPYISIPSGIKVPVYSTIHDVVFLDIRLSGFFGTAARRFFYKRAVRLSKAVFTVSKFSAKRIEKLLKPKVPVVVTYNACSPFFQETLEKGKSEVLFADAPFNKGKDAPIDNLTNAKKVFELLFVGNIKAHKGLATLLRALGTLPNTHLTIVGSVAGLRTKDNAVLKMIESLGGRVSVDSGATIDKLRQYYKEADLLVQPSLYEGFGMPPLEALNLGCRVVLSDIEVFREVYSAFPVTFFKTADSEDLALKISGALKKPKPILSDGQRALYTYDKCFKVIKSAIERGGST